MNPIKIQTKTKKNPKSIEFIGNFDPNQSIIIIDVDKIDPVVDMELYDDIGNFISSLQKNQKLELHIAYVSGTYEKLGNIKNLFINADDALEFESSFIKQTQEESPETVTKTSLQIFCDKWQRFDKGIDFHSLIRSVFQIDPRMSFSYNSKSDDGRKEILKFAAELIHKKIEEL